MARFWMVSNRDDGGFGDEVDATTYLLADGGTLSNRKSWRPATAAQFRDSILEATGRFPQVTAPEDHADQKHVTLFVHGYNNSWDEAAARYAQICKTMFAGADGLGICILFTWPSDGHAWDYLPDRRDAAASAGALSDLLNAFYDWLLDKQTATVEKTDEPPCVAKVSMIAHSMGNYVLQKAIQLTWTRKNQPMLVSLVNQLLMVAADVDNDLFKAGEASDKGDGDAIANLCYRVTALFTGRDDVLGMSAGLKHFGKRRLGRSGLDREYPVPDNVWDVDCSTLIPSNASGIHSAYFDAPKTRDLMTRLLRGQDRTVLQTSTSLVPTSA
jgi:esterase/lipase superfamily enzyme